MPGLIVLTTTPDGKSAKALAKILLIKKLAACVTTGNNFISSYRWKGGIETAKESLLIIKTLQKNFGKIKKIIQAVHPYEVPEIICLPIFKASPEYRSWMVQVLK